MMRGQIRPGVTVYSTPVRAAHPLSVWMSSVLGRLHGRGIDGHAGTVIIGAPGVNGGKSSGYSAPPQLFTGWNPRLVASGSVRPTPGGLPGTQAPSGEPVDAMTVAIARLSGMSGGR